MDVTVILVRCQNENFSSCVTCNMPCRIDQIGTVLYNKVSFLFTIFIPLQTSIYCHRYCQKNLPWRNEREETLWQKLKSLVPRTMNLYIWDGDGYRLLRFSPLFFFLTSLFTYISLDIFSLYWFYSYMITYPQYAYWGAYSCIAHALIHALIHAQPAYSWTALLYSI